MASRDTKSLLPWAIVGSALIVILALGYSAGSMLEIYNNDLSPHYRQGEAVPHHPSLRNDRLDRCERHRQRGAPRRCHIPTSPKPAGRRRA